MQAAGVETDMTFGMWRMLLGSRPLRNEGGSVAIEYALIAGLVSVAIVGGLMAVGGDLRLIFNSVSNGFTHVQ